jgi:hypothetical protein
VSADELVAQLNAAMERIQELELRESKRDSRNVVTLKRLTAFQTECGNQQLPVEMALADVARYALLFVTAFQNGGRPAWSSLFGVLAKRIGTLKEALRNEFPEIKGPQTTLPKPKDLPPDAEEISA